MKPGPFGLLPVSGPRYSTSKSWAANKWVTSYRAREAFDVAGRQVEKGERLEADDPDVNIVLKAHPGLLLVRVLRKET